MVRKKLNINYFRMLCIDKLIIIIKEENVIIKIKKKLNFIMIYE